MQIFYKSHLFNKLLIHSNREIAFVKKMVEMKSAVSFFQVP